MSPWSKAQVWALHTISEKRGLKITNEEITSLVWKVGSEGEEDGHPTNAAISQLRSVFAADPQWHPGKHEENAKKRGPKVKFDAMLAKGSQWQGQPWLLKNKGLSQLRPR